jgi:hypothetical protein
MRLSAVVIALSVALASIGCGEPGSAASPSPSGPTVLRAWRAPPAAQMPRRRHRPQPRCLSRADCKGMPTLRCSSLHPHRTSPHTFWPQARRRILGRFTMDYSHRVNLDTGEGIGDAVFTFRKWRHAEDTRDRKGDAGG